MAHFESSVVLIADVRPSRELIFNPENNATLYGSTRDDSSGGGLDGRHRGRKNILFLGGHVDSVRQGDFHSATEAPAQAESLWGSVTVK
jgi:prepilin-type processing-associated H-X9-DG protein